MSKIIKNRKPLEIVARDFEYSDYFYYNNIGGNVFRR